MSRGALVTAKARNALKEINQNGNKLALARDYVAQAYMGHWGGAATVEKVRSRVHWIAAEARGTRVLDIGTSEGIVPILLGREGFHVVGIDINAEAIDYANQLLEQEPEAVRERISFRPISLFQQEETPQFDTVIMGEVIQHVSNVESFVCRALQTLAPGGRLILTTPFGVHPDRDHKHTFFISDMQALFASRGRIESLTVVDGYIRLLFRNEEPAAAQEQLPALALPDVLALTEEATFASQSLLWRQIDQAGQRIEALQAQMEAAQQQAAQSDAARREQETALQEAGRELADLQERLRSADAAVEARKGELAEQREALEARDAEARRSREEAAEWQARCDALQQELRHLETDLVRAREQQTAFQETLAARDTAIQALEAAQAQRESELAAAREEAAAAAERLAERDRELDDLKATLAAQQETLAAAQARLAEQAQQLAEQEAILTEWAEECERLEAERRAAEARAAEHEQRLSEAEARHADAQERLEAREAQAGEQAAELDGLRRQLAERDAEVRRLSQALAAAEAAGRDLAQAQARLAKAETERQETARRLQEQQGLAAQRAQELDGLRKQLSDLEAKAKSQAEALARAQAAERSAAERLAERERALSAAETRLAEQNEALDARTRELESAQAARKRLESEAGGLRTRLEAATRQQRETARELASLKTQAAQQLTVLEGGERLRWVEPLLELFRRLELEPRKLANLGTALAKERYRDDPFAMLLLASLADALDPQPVRRKWLGFRMVHAGLLDGAEQVLAPLEGKLAFSASEQKAWEELVRRPKPSGSNDSLISAPQAVGDTLEIQLQPARKGGDPACRKLLLEPDVAPKAEIAEKREGGEGFEAGNAASETEDLQRSLKLPAPKPSTELLFSAHTEPMVRALKGEGSAAGQKAVVEAQAKPVEPAQAEPTPQTPTKAAAVPAKPMPVAKSQKAAPTKGTLGRRLKAISIMDEISEECWRYEMTAFPINRNNYKEQVAGSLADFCFLESCWKGNRGSWEYAFTSPGLKHANAQALLDLIPRVKKKMPLVFWNKEDPMHYDRYLPIAKSADIIFTTDETKVADYQRDVPEADVYAMPFAAQQRICNPSDRFRTAPESVCFAGSYYGVGHDERKRQMDALLPSIIEFKGAIYDRMSKIDSDRYKFPPQYAPFIRDAVPFTEVVKLYKRFKVFLNVNTIVESPTMMSRRVYELLACGTPVVSTPSKAIEEQFPGIVHVANDAQEANTIIEKLLTDEHYWEKTSHLGYREVMTKHTYTHRLQLIKQALGYEAGENKPLVSIITCTRRPNMIDRIVENMTRQNYPNCELILVLQDFTKAQAKELVDKIKATPSNIRVVKALVNDSSDTLGERFNKAAEIAQGEYIAKMDDDDFYFENYLSDMLIPFTFGDYGLVGKKELYMYLSGSDKLIKRFPGMKHREVDFVAGATFVFKADIFHKYKFNSLNRGEDSDLINRLKADGVKIYAADPFNFIAWRGDVTAHTWDATDDYFLSGKQTQVMANFLNKELISF